MENQSNHMKITVKSIIDIIFRHKMIIVITFIICVFATFIVLQLQTPVYDANVKILIRGQSIVTSDVYESIGARSIQATQAEIVRSVPVLKRAVIALNLQNRPFDYEKNYSSKLKKFLIDYQVKKIKKELKDFPPEEVNEIMLNEAIGNLKDRLTVNVLPMTDIFVINVTAFTPEEAIETANVISRSYTMFDQIQQLAEVRLRYGESHPTVIQLIDNIKEVTKNLSGKSLSDMEAIGTASVKIIEQATSSYKPITKSKKIILAAALFISICISFGLALVFGLFKKIINTPQDIVDHLNTPCIGSIPKKQKKDTFLITDTSPDSKYYSFYEELSEQLLVFLKTQGLKSVVITSPVNNKNHKYIVPNIGYFLSSIMKNKILLIDANFNTPQFQKIYSVSEENSIDGNIVTDISEDFVCKINRGPDVLLFKTVPEKPSIILRNIHFENFMENNKNKYDAILIDATSINNMKDVSFISEYCDGTVIIIDEGTLKWDMLKNSLTRLRSTDSPIIGGILNDRTFPVPEFIYKNFKYFID